MLFDIAHRVKLKAVAVKVIEEDSIVLRLMQLKLECPFTDEIAESLGPDAKAVREGLATNGIARAVLPIDAIEADAILTGGDGEEAVGL